MDGQNPCHSSKVAWILNTYLFAKAASMAMPLLLSSRDPGHSTIATHAKLAYHVDEHLRRRLLDAMDLRGARLP